MHSLFAASLSGGGASRSDSDVAKRPGTKATPRCLRFTNCRVLREHELRSGEDVWVDDGKIVDPKTLFWEGRVADEIIDCGGKIVAPGLIDLQLNGGWGVDFCMPGPELAPGLKLVAQKLLAHGVTAFLPTIITSSSDSYRSILPNLVPTAGSAKEGAAVLGVHLEGPFISSEKTGCHPPEHVVNPDGQADAMRRACGEHLAHVRLVTLAPEAPGASLIIAELVSQGIVVSAGHSSATSAQMEEAQRMGVRMCTHLFNAMPPFHPREPGIVGVLGSKPSLANPDAKPPFFGLIADGVHVHPASLKLAASARPESVVLVSDGMVALGLPPGTYSFGEVGQIDLKGDRVYRSGTETLAGAVLPLDECVRRFQRMCGCDAVRALEAATLHPAQVLGIEATKGTLAFGADADLILLDDEMRVHATYVAGHHAWTLADSAAAESGRDAAPSGAPRLPGATRSRATPPGDEDGAGPARKRRQR
jgi:N-acetylglucosamine-6-phosphate deacetylase